jgi:hypothetical protein
VSLLDENLFDLSRLQGYRQLTDLHLLGIAQRHHGTLVTLDAGTRESRHAVRNPPETLVRLLVS